DCDRFLEVWNLVFMQYDQTESGQRVPLPRPSIDTGMGLERVTAVVQGVRSNYETDLFMPIIDFVAARSDTAYKRGRETDTALQVIADHSRAIAFLIADQVLPSNEGRGYVLRRLIRRAFRFGRLLGLADPFLFETVREVSGLMAGAYPELEDNLEFTVRVVREEEERFSQTLDKGLAILEEEMDALAGENSRVISGDLAFKLYDTFGFPLDIVNDVAERRGMSVDEAGFRRCMDEQKKRAKKAWKGSGEKDLAGRFESLLKAGVRTIFSGYDATQGRSVVKSLLDDQGAYSRRLVQGQGGWLVAEETPFYGESGGQTGDVGGLETMTGSAEVLDTLKPSPGLTVHKIFVNEGEVLPDQEVRLNVDVEARLATARNHTCTHLLHAALRRVLGGHVKQSGSLVGPDRLRFDFTHIAPLTPEEIARVEEEVNRAIIENHGLRNSVVPYEEAVAKGAMALFGEKYADQVRMVEVPGVSVELCGGTHLSATGQAGSFVILSESGIAAGVRRIEAATGWNALAHFQSRSRRLDEAMAALKSGPDQVAEKIRGLQAQNKDLAREAERLSAKLAGGAGQDLLSRAEDIAGVKVLAAKVEAPSVKALREQVDGLRSRLASGIICLLAETGQGKVSVILSVSKDLLSRFTAPALIKDVAAEVNGGGGGRPDLAQAGGTDPAGADRALDRLRQGVAAAK
ncbi:MAG: alanine--tRNA ligase, partial [Desulfovibrionaceae bacterium]|nr:alanine--tRNA ligase [Desulfovibrionaceae bacterium]